METTAATDEKSLVTCEREFVPHELNSHHFSEPCLNHIVYPPPEPKLKEMKHEEAKLILPPDNEPLYSLLRPRAMEGLACALAAVDLVGGEDRLTNDALAHIFARMRGEERDQKTGLLHVDLAQRSLHILSEHLHKAENE